MHLVPVGLMLITISALGFGIGLRLLPLSLSTAMGPVVIWAFGSALVIPGATTAALAGFPKVAGAASALAGFLQIGVGLAGTAVAALLFSDPLTALATVMPSMAVLAVLAHFALPSKRKSRPFAVAPEELETAVDPAGAVGAGGEEIERAVHRGNR
jgi:MFS transporter, DHA1 family, multidrug resistance protein